MKLDSIEKKRLFLFLKKFLIVLVIGFLYFLFVKITGLSIPCVFYLITHKYCPGCGITRMFIDIIKFDFVSAASHNLFVLSILPFAFILFLYKMFVYIKTGENKTATWESIVYIILFLMCIAFTILRNIPAFEYLAP